MNKGLAYLKNQVAIQAGFASVMIGDNSSDDAEMSLTGMIPGPIGERGLQGQSIHGMDGLDADELVSIMPPGLGGNSQDITTQRVKQYVDFIAQGTNPPAPAAGILRFHSATTQGFTRFEQDNEAPTNIVLGRDIVFIAKNTTGSTLNPMQPVYITGSTGNVPNVGLAKSDVVTTLPAIGLVLDSIAPNAFGQIMYEGVMQNVNTSAFSFGDALYVDATTAGTLTKTRPVSPNIAQRMASVLVSGLGNGSLLVVTAPFLGGLESGTTATDFAALQFGSKSAPGNGGYFWKTAGGVGRWIARLENVETGANAGSDLDFLARDDSGAALSTPISIKRSSGVVTLSATAAASITGNAGTATALQTARAIYGNNFDGTAALAQVIASTYGGTGNGFTKFSGPTTSEKTFTLPDSSQTLLYSGGALGTPSSGTLTNCSGLPGTGVTAAATDWTPTANSFTVIGAQTLTGKYIKVGSVVTIWIYHSAATSVAATASTSNYTNFPFAPANSSASLTILDDTTVIGIGLVTTTSSGTLTICQNIAATARIIISTATYYV